LIAASAIGFDLGVQITLVAHQTIVFGIDPAARSRLNVVLFVGTFIGMSISAASGVDGSEEPTNSDGQVEHGTRATPEAAHNLAPATDTHRPCPPRAHG
jgi:hypothetical protein